MRHVAIVRGVNDLVSRLFAQHFAGQNSRSRNIIAVHRLITVLLCEGARVVGWDFLNRIVFEEVLYVIDGVPPLALAQNGVLLFAVFVFLAVFVILVDVRPLFRLVVFGGGVLLGEGVNEQALGLVALGVALTTRLIVAALNHLSLAVFLRRELVHAVLAIEVAIVGGVEKASVVERLFFSKVLEAETLLFNKRTLLGLLTSHVTIDSHLVVPGVLDLRLHLISHLRDASLFLIDLLDAAVPIGFILFHVAIIGAFAFFTRLRLVVVGFLTHALEAFLGDLIPEFAAESEILVVVEDGGGDDTHFLAQLALVRLHFLLLRLALFLLRDTLHCFLELTVDFSVFILGLFGGLSLGFLRIGNLLCLLFEHSLVLVSQSDQNAHLTPAADFQIITDSLQVYRQLHLLWMIFEKLCCFVIDMELNRIKWSVRG
mmetsp:Transcript_46789/g.61894  ORF Transcript_46789/g.61894 Transcript_46789/m.61894 type:complete len:429 (-) Transcript_46789:800-2086(-)